jgi:simple sugar transport system ATP-binding protein
MPDLAMRGMRKLYSGSGVLANEDASLSVSSGEIHALVGENGAGKSTLMKLLYGLERPDSGTIELDGRPVSFGAPHDAARAGLGMIQQHFTTLLDMSVADNVILGFEPRRAGLFVDRRRAESVVMDIVEANGFNLDPRALASSLTIGERQQLEIAKLLYRNADLLILDEPTAVLAEQEVATLFASLRRLKSAGKTVILITHKVGEVMALADSVTVMRRGRTVARFSRRELDGESLACAMMGEKSCADSGFSARAELPGREVFAMHSVSLKERGRKRPLLDGVGLSIRSGEILGICAVVGNGMGALENVASGFARPSSGSVLLEGEPLPRLRKPGLGYVPADRMSRGVCLDASVAENLAALDRGAFYPRGLADRGAMRAAAEAAIAEFSMSARPDSKASSLSGGNVQKLVLARELAKDASFYLFSNPTWGLDISSTAFVHERIRKARDRGAAILLISANLDEVLALADRVSALYRGRIACELANGPGLDRKLLGEYMLGIRKAEAHG